MKKLYVTLLVLFALGFSTNTSYAQQDAQYTQYMYNTLSVNPAYAGSRDVLSFLGLYRTQWVGLKGAPRTLTASIHSPIGKRIGLGLNVTNDEIFITKETYIDASFSYTIDVSETGQLAFGIKAGAHLLDIDSKRAYVGGFNPGDSDAQFVVDSEFSPQIGAGAYYYTDKLYLGLSVPNLLETEHFDESNNSNNNSFSTAKERMNYYLMGGYVFNLNENVKFKPAALLKVVEGSPLQADFSGNFLIYEKFTAGLAYRWSAALSGMIGFQVSDQIMLGFAYDRETTELAQYNDGSFEFFLRFELFKSHDRLLSPRFF